MLFGTEQLWEWTELSITVVHKPNIILLIIKGKNHDILGEINADGDYYIKSNNPYTEKIITAAFLSYTEYSIKFICVYVIKIERRLWKIKNKSQEREVRYFLKIRYEIYVTWMKKGGLWEDQENPAGCESKA